MIPGDNIDFRNRELELDFERIVFFYSSFVFSSLGVLAAVIFLGIGVSHFYSQPVAVVWATIVVVTYVPRVTLAIIFTRKLQRQEITPNNVRPWEWYGVLASIVPFLCFASVVFLPYQENTQAALLFCTIFVVMLVAGAFVAQGTSIGVLMLFLNINFLALIARSLWESDFMLNVLGVALIIGYVLLTRQILKLHRAMTENISMKFDSRHMSYIDPLTNLWNRRRLYLFLDKLIPAARRSNKPFSLILIDVDHFKQYNDTHGHNAGDELLTDISRVLLECSREQDLVVRYGGEEFMVVMPTTTTEQARPLAERIRAQVKETTAVTVSAGLGEFAGEATVDQLVKRADRALYAAKEAGRDTLKIADATE